MSVRQVSRINQELHLKELQKSNENASESSEEEVLEKRQTFAFDEESESEVESDISSEHVEQKNVKVMEQSIVEEVEDDIEYLENLIKDNATNNSNSTKLEDILTEPYFIIDSKSLDLDKVLNDKFSRNNFMRQFEGQQDGKKKQSNHNRGVMRKNLLSNHRSYLFGAPKEDWTRPPSYIGGGTQMIRTSDSVDPSISYFQFQWSTEYCRTNELYQLIQNTGDVNRLVMFIANHPYHIEGMLQLSMVFARLGLMDRASDMVRRCLYCYECCFIESFKPCNGLCRMNPAIPENSFFFQALFKHLQHCYTLGCQSLAVDLCRLMLSLDPTDRSYHLLLTLDYYLLNSAQFDLFDTFINSKSTETTIELTDFTTFSMPNPYSIGANSISDLPNWWYSLALCHYLNELDVQRKQSFTTNSTSIPTNEKYVVPGSASKHAVSSFMLQCAIYRYPFMLYPLMSKAGVSVGMFGNSKWSTIFNHQLFQGINISGTYLQRVCDIYAARCGGMWNTPEIYAWVLQAANTVITHSSSSMHNNEFFKELSCRSELSQYKAAKLEDFIEEVPRMPNEVNNLIDPQLMDPRVLAGGVRFDAQQLGVELPRNRPRMNRFEREQLEIRQKIEQASILDLTMPLMELFFVSLCPWFRLPAAVKK